MPSKRSRVVKRVLKSSALIRSTLTADNLETKRRSYGRLSRYFRAPKDTTVTPLQGSGFKGEWINVPATRKDTVILYVHGGGFVFGSPEVHRGLIARIAKAANARAFSLDYSLAPEHPFPAPVEEALAAYLWLLEHYAPEKVILAGDSAGGSVVLSLLQIIQKKHMPNPACAVALSPATDAYNVTKAIQENAGKDFFIKPSNLQFFIDAYFQDTPRNDPIASPLYGSLQGFPPLLIHVDKDELFHIGIQSFVEKARKENVEISTYEATGLWHVWHLFAGFMPEAKEAIAQIGEFIRAHVT